MKKLIVLASFFALFLLIAGCQSETPVQPGEEGVTLEKFSLSVSPGLYWYQVQLVCSSAGGRAAKYRFYYRYSNDLVRIETVDKIAVNGYKRYQVIFDTAAGDYVFGVEVLDKNGNVIKSLNQQYEVIAPTTP